MIWPFAELHRWKVMHAEQVGYATTMRLRGDWYRALYRESDNALRSTMAQLADMAIQRDEATKVLDTIRAILLKEGE